MAGDALMALEKAEHTFVKETFYHIKSIYMKTKRICLSRVFAAMLLAGFVQSCHGQAGIEGTWVEPVPGMEHMTQGFRLEDGGRASSVNMATLQYETWKRDGNRLILSGNSIGNGLTAQFTDTLVVEKLTEDSLIVRKKALTLRYARDNGRQAKESVPMTKLTPAKRRSFVAEGTLVMAHEVRSFTPKGETEAYWIADKSGELAREYDKLTKGVKNGTPVHAELEVVDMGKADEGFAKSYEGVYEVVKVKRLSPAPKSGQE